MISPSRRRGSILVRHGKNDRRREVGMDAWGWSAIEPWLTDRVGLPVGALFCVIDGPTRGRAWSDSAARVELRQLALNAGVRRRFAPHQLRHAHAVELMHEGIPLPLIQMPVAPGRNVAILVEIAARNQLLRARGHHAARKLADRLERQLKLAGLDRSQDADVDEASDPGEEQ